jgi:diguanylate cyclase (GGDEF)-like protein
MTDTSLKGWINRRLAIALVVMLLFSGMTTLVIMGWIFSDFEKRRTQSELSRVAALLERDGQSFAAVAGDYGFWHDSYTFLQGQNPNYWNHFTANLMINSQMDWVFVQTADHQPFAARMLEQGQAQPATDAQRLALSEAYMRVHVQKQHDCKKGTAISWFNQQPVLLAYAPVVDSLGQQPQIGCIVFGRWLNQAYQAQIKTLTGAGFEIEPRELQPSQRTVHHIKMDVPALGVRLSRHIEPQMTPEKWSAIAVLMLNGVALLAILLWVLGSLIQHKITNRISRFSDLADQYRATHNNQIRWPKPTHQPDEIDNLGQALNDLVQQVEAQMRSIAYDAEHDALTGVGNRRFLLRHLSESIGQASHQQALGALLLIDLDSFKLINDHLGHPIGDQTLTVIAKRISEAMRNDDVVVRLGGDEFAVFLPDVHADGALQVAQRLCEQIAYPLQHDHQLSLVTASIGIVMVQAHLTAVEMLRHADIAMYEAKRWGKNQAKLYDVSMDQAFSRRIEIEKAVRQALEQPSSNSFLELWYQPIVASDSHHIQSVEALLRWKWQGQYVSPQEFIAIAEETDLIVQLGDWVIDQAGQMLQRMAQAGWGLRCSVNVSLRQFVNQKLVAHIQHTLAHYQLSPQALAIEVTESLLAEREEDVVAQLRQLSDLGIHVYLDDFGTGYSSLGRLQQMPLHTLKIDRSFVAPLEHGKLGLVEAIVEMAKRLQLQLIAEGVETATQLDILQRLGVEGMQGYYFAKPMAEVLLMQWLHEQAHRQIDQHME